MLIAFIFPATLFSHSVPATDCHCTAGALIAFIFPAWVALGALRSRDPAAMASPAYWRLNAWALLALGAVQAVAGVATTLFLNRNNDQGGKGAGDGGVAGSLLSYLY